MQKFVKLDPLTSIKIESLPMLINSICANKNLKAVRLSNETCVIPFKSLSKINLPEDKLVLYVGITVASPAPNSATYNPEKSAYNRFL